MEFEVSLFCSQQTIFILFLIDVSADQGQGWANYNVYHLLPSLRKLRRLKGEHFRNKIHDSKWVCYNLQHSLGFFLDSLTSC